MTVLILIAVLVAIGVWALVRRSAKRKAFDKMVKTVDYL